MTLTKEQFFNYHCTYQRALIVTINNRQERLSLKAFLALPANTTLQLQGIDYKILNDTVKRIS